MEDDHGDDPADAYADAATVRQLQFIRSEANKMLANLNHAIDPIDLVGHDEWRNQLKTHGAFGCN